MTFTAINIASALLVGLVAGCLGGMLGIGGSVVMIPGLAVLHPGNPESQHLFQAAAMAVNVAVAVPAALRHRRAGAVPPRLFTIVLAAGFPAIVAGVLLSNRIDGLLLRRVFAVFLVYVAVVSIVKLFRKTPDVAPGEARVTWLRGGAVGAVMGFAAGMLGIGGGVLAVPMAMTLCRLPLRHCIGVSSAAMCFTAVVGAALKIGTLPQHGFEPWQAGVLALTLAPTALLGGWLGAGLTHRLPLAAVRTALIALLLAAAWRMALAPNASTATPPPDSSTPDR